MSEAVDLGERMARPRIGLLTTGHFYYWDQFPRLKEMGMRMFDRLRASLEEIGEIVAPELVDTKERALKANEYFRREQLDVLLVFPFGYTPGMCVLPAIEGIDVLLRLMNSHEDGTYDYRNADTTVYLHHEGPCCIPEYSAGLVNRGRKFKVRTGPFSSNRLWQEVRADCEAAATARFFRSMNVGLMGETYTNMVDMPFDEHRLLRSTGNLLIRPEVEEIEEAYHRVTKDQLEAMVREFREVYDVDQTVTDEHMTFSAQLAVAYDEIIHKHDIWAFGYYWWGEKELTTQLRAQSGLAVSRLAAMGRPRGDRRRRQDCPGNEDPGSAGRRRHVR